MLVYDVKILKITQASHAKYPKYDDFSKQGNSQCKTSRVVGWWETAVQHRGRGLVQRTPSVSRVRFWLDIKQKHIFLGVQVFSHSCSHGKHRVTASYLIHIKSTPQLPCYFQFIIFESDSLLSFQQLLLCLQVGILFQMVQFWIASNPESDVIHLAVCLMNVSHFFMLLVCSDHIDGAKLKLAFWLSVSAFKRCCTIHRGAELCHTLSIELWPNLIKAGDKGLFYLTRELKVWHNQGTSDILHNKRKQKQALT